MFKKKENIVVEKQVCSVDAKLSECGLIEAIRRLQNELSNIETINISDIASKYIFSDDNSWYHKEMQSFVMALSMYYPLRYGTYKKMLSELGKDMDNYKNKNNLILEIQNKIKEAKNKLGIS